MCVTEQQIILSLFTEIKDMKNQIAELNVMEQQVGEISRVLSQGAVSGTASNAKSYSIVVKNSSCKTVWYFCL